MLIQWIMKKVEVSLWVFKYHLKYSFCLYNDVLFFLKGRTVKSFHVTPPKAVFEICHIVRFVQLYSSARLKYISGTFIGGLWFFHRRGLAWGDWDYWSVFHLLPHYTWLCCSDEIPKIKSAPASQWDNLTHACLSALSPMLLCNMCPGLM